jgi:branched-chain amino acid transport system permease protein
MTAQVETVRIAAAAERVEWLPILKRSALVALVTFLLTIGIVGFETVSSTGQLALTTRFGPVAFAVAAAFIGYVAIELLRLRRPVVPLIIGSVAFLLLALALFAEGPYSPLQWLLPFEALALDWAALAFPLIIVLRALYIATSARARATGAATPLAGMGEAVRRITPWLGAFAIVFAIALPFMPFADRRLIDVCTLVLTYIMLGWGLNVVVGLAGLLDLGYVAFYAVGAYSYALIATHFGWSFWVCLPLAGLFAAGFGVLLGFPVLRLRGDYLAIVTLGFGEMIRIILINWWWFTGGPNGINNVPRPSFFGLPFERNPPAGTESFSSFFGLDYSPNQRVFFLYYLILACALVTNFFTLRIRRMPLGRAWEALREDEIACRALGINPRNTKLTAFAFGAMFAGFAGSFFAARQGFVSPESFVFLESAVILAIVVLGGLGSQVGIVLAAVVLIGVPEFFRQLMDFRMLAFGLGMVLIMLWRPGGLLAHREPTIRLHGKHAERGKP